MHISEDSHLCSHFHENSRSKKFMLTEFYGLYLCAVPRNIHYIILLVRMIWYITACMLKDRSPQHYQRCFVRPELCISSDIKGCLPWTLLVTVICTCFMIIIAGMTAYIEHVSVLLCSLGLYQNNFDDLIEQQLIPELLHFENTFNYNSI